MKCARLVSQEGEILHLLITLVVCLSFMLTQSWKETRKCAAFGKDFLSLGLCSLLLVFLLWETLEIIQQELLVFKMTKRCSHLPPLSPLVNHPETKTKKKVKKKRKLSIFDKDRRLLIPKTQTPLSSEKNRLPSWSDYGGSPTVHNPIFLCCPTLAHTFMYTHIPHTFTYHTNTHTCSHLLHTCHTHTHTHTYHTLTHTQTYDIIHTYITHHTHICTYLTCTHTYNFQSAFLCTTFKYDISGSLGIWENVSANKRPKWTERKKEFRGNKSMLTWVNILRWKNIL